MCTEPHICILLDRVDLFSGNVRRAARLVSDVDAIWLSKSGNVKGHAVASDARSTVFKVVYVDNLLSEYAPCALNGVGG